MRVLCIGDIVGRPGRVVCQDLLPRLIDEMQLDFVIANGENAAGGFGLTEEIADSLLDGGVDVITTGNHVLAKRGIESYLMSSDRMIRPANWPPGGPGHGATVVPDRQGTLVGVLNLQGVVFMDSLDCPFRKGREEIEKLRHSTRVIIVDFHAEATAEKVAFAWHVDGKVSAVVGTHTHVQTADERLLPKGTGFICDLGMTGPIHSVIGMDTEIIVEKFINKLPKRFEVASGPAQLCGVVIDIDEDTGRSTAIERVRIAPGEKVRSS